MSLQPMERTSILSTSLPLLISGSYLCFVNLKWTASVNYYYILSGILFCLGVIFLVLLASTGGREQQEHKNAKNDNRMEQQDEEREDSRQSLSKKKTTNNEKRDAESMDKKDAVAETAAAANKEQQSKEREDQRQSLSKHISKQTLSSENLKERQIKAVDQTVNNGVVETRAENNDDNKEENNNNDTITEAPPSILSNQSTARKAFASSSSSTTTNKPSKPLSEDEQNNTTWRCACEGGFLPPGLLKSFGGAEAVLRLGSGQCYHKG